MKVPFLILLKETIVYYQIPPMWVSVMMKGIYSFAFFFGLYSIRVKYIIIKSKWLKRTVSIIETILFLLLWYFWSHGFVY